MVEQHRVLGKNPQWPHLRVNAVTEDHVIGFEQTQCRWWQWRRLRFTQCRRGTLRWSNAVIQSRLDADDPPGAMPDHELVTEAFHIQPYNSG
jgi:hypothetical protein